MIVSGGLSADYWSSDLNLGRLLQAHWDRCSADPKSCTSCIHSMTFHLYYGAEFWPNWDSEAGNPLG